MHHLDLDHYLSTGLGDLIVIVVQDRQHRRSRRRAKSDQATLAQGPAFRAIKIAKSRVAEGGPLARHGGLVQRQTAILRRHQDRGSCLAADTDHLGAGCHPESVVAAGRTAHAVAAGGQIINARLLVGGSARDVHGLGRHAFDPTRLIFRQDQPLAKPGITLQSRDGRVGPDARKVGLAPHVARRCPCRRLCGGAGNLSHGRQGHDKTRGSEHKGTKGHFKSPGRPDIPIRWRAG